MSWNLQLFEPQLFTILRSPDPEPRPICHFPYRVDPGMICNRPNKTNDNEGWYMIKKRVSNGALLSPNKSNHPQWFVVFQWNSWAYVSICMYVYIYIYLSIYLSLSLTTCICICIKCNYVYNCSAILKPWASFKHIHTITWPGNS